MPLTLWKFERWIRRQLLFFCNLLQYGQQNGPRFSPWASRTWTFKLRVFTNSRLHCTQVNFTFVVCPVSPVEERAKNQWCVNIICHFKCWYNAFSKIMLMTFMSIMTVCAVTFNSLKWSYYRNKFSQALVCLPTTKNQKQKTCWESCLRKKALGTEDGKCKNERTKGSK